MDLSFPVSCSVNDGIPKDTFLGEPFQLCLPGVEALATLIRHCRPNCLIFKKDLLRAYQQFRLTLMTIITLDIPLTIYFSLIQSSLLDFVQLLWLASMLPKPFNFSILFKVSFQPILWMILVVVTHLKKTQIPFMPFNNCFISLASTLPLRKIVLPPPSGNSLQHCGHDCVHPSRETLRAPAAYHIFLV